MAGSIPKYHAIMFSDGKTDFNVAVKSTTGFVAVQDARGERQIFEVDGKERVHIARGDFVAIWSCSGQFLSANAAECQASGDLIFLDCANNHLQEIEIVSETLTEFICSHNRLRELHLSSEGSLKRSDARQIQFLNCSQNLISSLDVSNLTQVKEINCSHNQILKITLGSKLSHLRRLDCSVNRLPVIDLSGLIALEYLKATNNRMGQTI